jgi:hypothetical protein
MTAIWLVIVQWISSALGRYLTAGSDEMCWRVRKTCYAELFSPWVQLGEGVEDTRRRAKLSEIVAKHPKT